MLTLIKRKLQNKKCLNGCLLLGIVLFVAISASTPMFKRGSLNKLIQSKFLTYIEENNEYPTVLRRNGSRRTEKISTVKELSEQLDAYGAEWQDYLKIPSKTVQKHMWIGKETEIIQQYGGEGHWPSVSCIPDMKEHIQILKGISLEEYKPEKGSKKYPCLITEKLMDEYQLVVNEEIQFEGIEDEEGNLLTMQIVGILDEKDNTDIFWHKNLDELEAQVFINEASMDAIIKNFSCDLLYYRYYMLLDYSNIKSKHVSDLTHHLQQLKEKDDKFTDNFAALLNAYEVEKDWMDTIFLVLELPITLLLLAFVYMVSGQILEMESGEIAMFKSRGFSRKQIIYMYIRQSGILAGIGMVLGIPLGYLFCKLAASTDAFLQFTSKSTAVYKFTPEMFGYAFGAALLTIAFMTLPVIGYSKYSIVQQKTRKMNIHSVNIIEKYFLDIISLAVSVYLLFNYSKQKNLIAWDVMTGENLDPLIFLNVFFFLFACGFVGLRLIKYLIRFIYFIGREKWKPHMYASFLEIMRTAGKRNFISVFLVLTISMGIFNSNMAETINTNNEIREQYNVGADVVGKEQWKIYSDPNLFVEPDYERYEKLKEGICGNLTRVVRDDNTTISKGNHSIIGGSMLGVDTKEFGETVKLQDGLNEKHWYNYLNELAKNPSGVLISKNIAEELSLRVGDSITYTRFFPLISKSKTEMGICDGIVCGIFDAWPGYQQYSYGYEENNKDEEEWQERQKYMIVVNYAYEANVFGMTPYEIWMDLESKANVSDVRNYLDEQNIKMEYVTGVDENIKEIRDSAMIQITNGLFTLSFLIAVILCTVGFLIYWITSIKQRELLFGIYRAMGMSMKEINKMLINEQIFSSLLAGVMGGITGFTTTLLFVKLVAIVYLPESHNIPLNTIIDVADMCKLGIIVLLMIAICLAVLRYILKNSNITQAIKMGED